MNNNLLEKIGRYLPKYSEIDSLILFLLISTYLLISDQFRSILFSLFSLGTSGTKILVLCILYFVCLGVGSYYALNIKIQTSKKIQRLIAISCAFVVSIFSLIVGYFMLNYFQEFKFDYNIIITQIFIAINLAKAIFTMAYLRGTDNGLAVYNPNNAKLLHIIIVVISLFILIIYYNQTNLNIFLIMLNIYSITSLIANLPFLNQQQKSTNI